MANEYVPIGKLFNVQKGQLQSTKCTPGEFDFITAAEDWKTHESFEYDCEALIFAAAASGSLGRTHYVDGKFISSDLCYILTPKDEQAYPLNLAFYHFAFNSLRSVIVKATKSGTSKESINQSNFNKFELPYFDIEQQDLWISKLKDTLVRKDLIVAELEHQQALLKKLRQCILQDAIEGKLTVNWRLQNPNIESASKLLEYISAKKYDLIKDKKLKKGSKQESNKLENIFFEIPDSWEFPDLDDITQFVTDGTHQTPKYTKQGRIFLSAQNVKPFNFMPENHKFVSEEDYINYIKNKNPEKGDLLVGRVGSQGEEALIDRDIEFAFYVSLCLVKTFKTETSPEFLEIVMNSPYGNAYASGNMSSLGSSAGNFNLGRIRSFPIPFPPIAEQLAIVAKVKSLFALCEQIEAKINSNENNAEQLMQAVLKEAFTQSDSPLTASIKEATYA